MDDEDHIVPQSAGPEGLDLMDETQDFRFLQTARTDHPTIPRRGEKDFESHGTSAQQSTLADSRDAMHAALSGLGLHPPSLHPTSPNPSQNQDQKTQSQRVQAPKVAVTATYDPRRGTTVVDVARGQHFRTLGQVRGGSGNGAGRVELMPEEALYLLERGNLDVFVRGLEEEEEEEDDDDGDEEGDEEGEDVSGDQEVEGLAKNGVRDEVKDAKEGPRTRTTAATTATRLPMSLQMAYTIYVGMGGLTLEEYSVYASLKRSGYIVTRTQQPSAKPITSGSSEKPASQISTSRQRGWAWDFWALPSWGGAFDRTAQGPLVPHGVYRSYSMFRVLVNAKKEILLKSSCA
ncbi:hypothetical protein MMC25_005599 [Agyrium rufum]|nr:hypothetical protein [Agyrium rufum]